MTAPQRIQLRRTKGWRKPDGAIVVARPGRWGNPFKPLACMDAGFADNPDDAHRVCVEAYRDWLSGNPWAAGASPEWEQRRSDILDHLDELRGHDLACWCPPSAPCHADVLLEIANRPSPDHLTRKDAE